MPVTGTSVLSLLQTLREHAADPELLRLLPEAAALEPEQRSWTRLRVTADLELWLIAWPPESRTDWHDHGPAAGAFTVLRGALVEHTWRGALQLHDVRPGDVRAFAAGHIHDVRNASGVPALSLHAYSPRLEQMTRYRFLGDRVRVLGVEKAGEGW